MNLEKFRESAFGPTLVIFTICAVITVILAFVYQVTLPIIEQGNIDAANHVRSQVLPGAESFTKIEGIQLPEGVSEAYKDNAGSGYVFSSAAKGYSGSVTFLIGINTAGKITGINMFKHNETPGLGTKIAAEAHVTKYYGDNDPNAVNAITGATLTSNALKNSVLQALEAFNAVKGVK